MVSTSECLKQIFFWKKTIKVSGQSPGWHFFTDHQVREPATPKRENCQVPNRWLLKKTPGYQKGQYFGAFWMGSKLPALLQKRRGNHATQVKITACKVCGSLLQSISCKAKRRGHRSLGLSWSRRDLSSANQAVSLCNCPGTILVVP